MVRRATSGSTHGWPSYSGSASTTGWAAGSTRSEAAASASRACGSSPWTTGFEPAGAAFDATADHYVAAVPVEVLRESVAMDALKRASPALAVLDRLQVRWMNGIMYYLTARRPAGPRAHDLHRLRVGADVDLAAPVLAPVQPARHGRRQGRRHPVGRHLGLGHDRRVLRQRQDRQGDARTRRSRPRSGTN